MLTISSDRLNAAVGSHLFIDAINSSFPNNIKHTSVFIGNSVAKIISYSPNKLSILIPNGLQSGTLPLYVFNSLNSEKSNTIQLNIFYENKFFDDNQTIKNDTKFFSKNSLTYAIYSRDLSYSNFSEIIDENSIIQNVLSIILTKKGERIFNPDFGTNIENALFSITESPDLMEKSILFEIKSQVSTFEPRATILDDLSFVNLDQYQNSLFIILYIKLPGGNTKELGVSISSIKKG